MAHTNADNHDLGLDTIHRSTSIFACVLVLVLVFFHASAARAQVPLPGPGKINTVAGNGTPGYSGDTHSALGAELQTPRGVAVDTSGNIYIADELNNVIRRVTATTDLISTVAGNGTAGHSGDGGPATSATLDIPFAVAIDAKGNVYIADTGNNEIRVLNTGSTSITIAGVTIPPGDISTVAGNYVLGPGYGGDGGPATNARLYAPSGLALDAKGNIYVVDEGNNVIRAVNTGNTSLTIAGITIGAGDINTIAGNHSLGPGYNGDGISATSAQLNSPEGVAVDSAANIYIADNFNNRVRKVSASSGTISTYAGNGTLGTQCNSTALDSPSGVALDSVGSLYVADFGNECIRKVSTTGSLSTIAGNGNACTNPTGNPACGDGGPATSATFNNPYGVGVDGNGNVYVADMSDSRIRAVGSPCNPVLSPASASYNQNGGTGSITVTAPTGCSWSAISNVSWVTITSGGSGTGNGSVGYSVAPLSPPTLAYRVSSDAITVRGQFFAISQTRCNPFCGAARQ